MRFREAFDGWFFPRQRGALHIAKRLRAVARLPRPGDPHVYAALDSLNTARAALHPAELTRVFLDGFEGAAPRAPSGEPAVTRGAVRVGDAALEGFIAHRQSGAALRVAQAVGPDPYPAAREAIESLCFTAHRGGLAPLSRRDGRLLELFLAAPSPRVRKALIDLAALHIATRQRGAFIPIRAEQLGPLGRALLQDDVFTTRAAPFIAALVDTPGAVLGATLRTESVTWLKAIALLAEHPRETLHAEHPAVRGAVANARAADKTTGDAPPFIGPHARALIDACAYAATVRDDLGPPLLGPAVPTKPPRQFASATAPLPAANGSSG